MKGILFIDFDAIELTRFDGSVVTCYRTNMDSRRWRPIWVDRNGNGEREAAPEGAAEIVLPDAVLDAIYAVERIAW